MSTPARVCIVSPSHVASSPRVVKEADALQSAGFDVTVLASDHYEPVRKYDTLVLAKARWKGVLLAPPQSRVAGTMAKLRREASRVLVRLGYGGLANAVRANFERHHEFVEAAVKIHADLYIGHTISGLAIAAEAARLRGVPLGFDAEDWHRGEQSEDHRPKGLTCAIGIIEDSLVPRCDHFTAASPLIGRAYSSLGKRGPVTILNVFPLSDAPVAPAAEATRAEAVYWFSQTIGPDRGLEAIVRGFALLPPHWELHLRGTPQPGYREALVREVSSLGMAERIKWLPRAPADQMVSLAAPYAAALAVELRHPGNRAICLTNKVFTYLLAGTPVLLSATPAHRLLLPDLGDAARLVEIDEPRAVADAILALNTPSSREKAWNLGRERYNWEFESRALVASVRAALVGAAA